MKLKINKIKEDGKDMLDITLEVDESQEEQEYMKELLSQILGGTKMDKELDEKMDKLIENNKEHWLSELDNINEEIWRPDFEATSREEVIKITKEHIEEDDCDSCKFRIGRRVKMDFPTVDAELIIEELKNIADDNIGELAETFLESTTVEQDEELTNEINEVIRKWVDKHGLDPEYYMVLDEEVIEVRNKI